jgi:hypothetical protein
MRSALRAVISNCIYGVDINPMSVELCKVSLWMEALEPGKPLSFLDAHIQCGDSLVGVSPGLDISEIPDEAFNPAFGDDKATASALKKRNKRVRTTGQMSFLVELAGGKPVTEDVAKILADRAAQVDAMPEDDSTQVQAKAKAFDDYHNAREYLKERLELDLWPAAFFWSVSKAEAESMLAPTQQELIQLRNGGELDARLVEKVRELAERLNFFHWELAFPNVFSGENAGFDCVLGNPPWERIKLQEEEFFAQRDPEIANARNRAARQKLIAGLDKSNPMLADAFKDARHAADATSKFIRMSGRYPLTAVGDVNTYTIFTELARRLLSGFGRSGIICPPGIASDDTTKDFFSDLMEKRNLVSLIAFVNEKFIFQDVLHNFRFCALTISGDQSPVDKSDFVYECETLNDISQSERHVTLTISDLSLLNPNTRTAPVFRTGAGAELNKKIYRSVPIFINEVTDTNFWGAKFGSMFHMANDSHYFANSPQNGYVPLYEAKMMHQFNHRFGSFENTGGERAHMLPSTPLSAYQNPSYQVQPCYWVPHVEVENRLENWDNKWLLGFREIASKALERTATFTILPRVGIGNKIPLIFLLGQPEISLTACFLANANSLVFDYATRQKINAASFSFFILKQLPILPPSAYTPADIDFIAPRVLELVYTAYDLRPFAEDMGYHGEPFRWDEVRRAQLRAELDAYYARLYGLTRDELRYILDPKEVYGEDFPGETFRVLKEKEIKQFGEYRTRRLVLEAWDRLSQV